MASPQTENGYLRLANELAEALMKAPLNGSQWRVVMGVIRESYGWDRKLAPLSLRRLAAMTGMDRRNVRREIATLVTAGVIVRQDQDGEGTMLGMGKDYESWKLDRGRGLIHPLGSTGDRGRGRTGDQKGGVNSPPNKEKKERLKKVRAEKQPADPRFKRIVEHYCQLYEKEHKEKADFESRDGKALREFLQRHSELSVEAICARMDNAFQSTSGYPLDQKFRLYEFLPQHAKYTDGPRHRKSSGQSDGKSNGQGELETLAVGRSRPTPEGEAKLKKYGVH